MSRSNTVPSFPDPHEDCRRRIQELERRVDALLDEVVRLRGVEEENRRLRRRVTDLEKKLDEARRAQKRQAAPFSKGPPKRDPKPPGRKPGKDYGPKAHRRPPEHIDEVLPVALPPTCQGCGGEIEKTNVAEQFQVEIPSKPIYRKFEIEVGRCRCCGSRIQGRHPLQTSDALGAARSQLGPNLQAMIAMLKEETGVSYGDIEQILRDFFKIPLSRGGASHVVYRVAERVDAAYQGIQTAVRESQNVTSDETGWRVMGLPAWLWVFCSPSAVLFKIHPNRGFEVAEAILGADYAGRLIRDGWISYDGFQKASHQICLRHLITRCRELLETAVRGAVHFPKAVKDLLQKAIRLRDRRDTAEISPRGLRVAQGRLESTLDWLLAQRRTNDENRKLANHLAKHRDHLFLFLEDPEVAPTNTAAEQAIRFAVVNRKVFGGNREPTGAWALERIASVLATCRKRGAEALDYLSRVLCTAPTHRNEFACRELLLLQPP